jgi:hypothetical protein
VQPLIFGTSPLDQNDCLPPLAKRAGSASGKLPKRLHRPLLSTKLVVRARMRGALATDVMAREAASLHGVGASKPPLLPSHEAEASMAPPAVRVANDMVTS